MKLKDLKIGMQLRIGLGAILVFVAFLGAMAWIQVNSCGRRPVSLYDHPLMVTKGPRRNKSRYPRPFGWSMKDLFLAESDLEQESHRPDLDICRSQRLPGRFDILYDRYLGPRNDIDDIPQCLVQWKSIRDGDHSPAAGRKVAEAGEPHQTRWRLGRQPRGNADGSHPEDQRFRQKTGGTSFTGTPKGKRCLGGAAWHRARQPFCLFSMSVYLLVVTKGSGTR